MPVFVARTARHSERLPQQSVCPRGWSASTLARSGSLGSPPLRCQQMPGARTAADAAPAAAAQAVLAAAAAAAGAQAIPGLAQILPPDSADPCPPLC